MRIREGEKVREIVKRVCRRTEWNKKIYSTGPGNRASSDRMHSRRNTCRFSYEYDAKKHIRQEKEESWEEGFQDGEKKGFRDGERKGFQDGQELLMKQLIKVKLDNGKTIAEIGRELEQSEERIQELVGKLRHGE